MNRTTFTVANDKRTLVVERTFNVPKGRVWEAYSNPELLAKWWGPTGWTTQIKHMDFSDGGYWHYGMKCMDPEQIEWYGKTSWGKGTFKNITPTDSFEYTDVFCDENGTPIPGMPVAHTRMTLAETGGATTVTFETEYETPEALARVLEMGMKEGFTQTLDRLEEILGS